MAQISLHSLIIAFPVCTHAENEGCIFEAHMMIKKVSKSIKHRHCCPSLELLQQKHIQQTCSGSNIDGLFTMAVSNSFLSPLKKSHCCRFRII